MRSFGRSVRSSLAQRSISYVAPRRDIDFVLFELLKADKVGKEKKKKKMLKTAVFLFKVYKERGLSVDRELLDGLIGECAKFAENVLAPLNVIGLKSLVWFLSPSSSSCAGDKEGAKHDPATNNVTTPTGFKDAYEQYASAGWQGLCVPEEYGGQGVRFEISVGKNLLTAI